MTSLTAVDDNARPTPAKQRPRVLRIIFSAFDETSFRTHVRAAISVESDAWQFTADEYDDLIDELMERARGLLRDVWRLEISTRRLEAFDEWDDAEAVKAARHLWHVVDKPARLDRIHFWAAFRDSVSEGRPITDGLACEFADEICERAMRLQASIRNFIVSVAARLSEGNVTPAPAAAAAND